MVPIFKAAVCPLHGTINSLHTDPTAATRMSKDSQPDKVKMVRGRMRPWYTSVLGYTAIVDCIGCTKKCTNVVCMSSIENGLFQQTEMKKIKIPTEN